MLQTNLTQLGIQPGASGAAQAFEDFRSRIDRYDETRNFPAIRGPSYLSVHLRFGTISVRQLASYAVSHGSAGAQTWLSELIWRDFYQMILWHHPHVAERAFRPGYDAIAWESGTAAEAAFAAWCDGRTGYPLVDAAMAQLNQTGYMHNRLRMVVASFLTKDLGIDYRRGEQYFAQQLNDFDLAANNGGWQWAASTGCDAQPYFRIFNPVTQSEKFDPEGAFIKRYLPQLASFTAKEIHAPWLASAARQRETGCVIGDGLSGTDCRSRGGTEEDAGAVRSREAPIARGSLTACRCATSFSSCDDRRSRRAPVTFFASPKKVTKERRPHEAGLRWPRLPLRCRASAGRARNSPSGYAAPGSDTRPAQLRCRPAPLRRPRADSPRRRAVVRQTRRCWMPSKAPRSAGGAGAFEGLPV